MKSRASLALMEQLVMILVFSLCAALCLSLFVRADSLSRETELQDRAVLLAQNGAETVKGCQGDLSRVAEILEGRYNGNGLTVLNEPMTMTISPVESQIPGLGMAQIVVMENGSAEVLFSVTVAWQEVG